MKSLGFRKGYILLGMGILLAGFLGVGFWFRAPVLFVMDAPFNALYGPRRTKIKRLETSIRMLRQLKPVIIGDNTGPDMVSFAVEEAHASPYGVLFPYRYYEGAERYVAQFPQVPVFILGARNRDPKVAGAIFVGTDAMLDLYRAGLCAGIIAGHEAQENGDESALQGEVLFFQSEGISTEYREAFSMGLREQGFTKEPQYLNINQDYADIYNISCVVIQGQVSSFLERNLEIPVILFSWVDPYLTSRAVKLVFDDSPWAVVRKMVAMIPKRQGEAVPSEWVIPGHRILDKEVSGRLKKALLGSML
jgi:hypothetical protein